MRTLIYTLLIIPIVVSITLLVLSIAEHSSGLFLGGFLTALGTCGLFVWVDRKYFFKKH